ncbi:MAG TPA: phage portal protein [Solirubrobacterales bacterium]|nr:phage portal protein [Solirubrobacterales bacterium]
MPLNSKQVVEQVRLLHGYHLAERLQLDRIRRYWKGRQALPAVIPSSAPNEVHVMSQSSRVNVMPIVVNSLVQSLFVDGFRANESADDLQVWEVWQANRMDKRQSGIHRAGFGFGASYGVVVPGDPDPVIRGVSPRSLTVLYGEDPEWPIWGLEKLGNGLWKLYDDEAFYYAEIKAKSPLYSGDDSLEITVIDTKEHGLEVTPIVRYLDEEDLDDEDEVEAENGAADLPVRGQVSPLMPLQDQIDLTTFDLQIAQHYGAFRQRYILGWVADGEADKLKASAARVWTFDEDPSEISVGEFEQTDVKGFLESRESSLRHAATLSQTPVHELTGSLINLSAEALAAAEAGKDRKVNERQTGMGESHEQMLWLVGRASSPQIDVPLNGQVVWRDTSARAFAATVDGLGKLAQMLNVPPEELWERIPGVTKDDVDRWKKTAQSGSAFGDLAALLDRQAGDLAGVA